MRCVAKITKSLIQQSLNHEMVLNFIERTTINCVSNCIGSIVMVHRIPQYIEYQVRSLAMIGRYCLIKISGIFDNSTNQSRDHITVPFTGLYTQQLNITSGRNRIAQLFRTTHHKKQQQQKDDVNVCPLLQFFFFFVNSDVFKIDSGSWIDLSSSTWGVLTCENIQS